MYTYASGQVPELMQMSRIYTYIHIHIHVHVYTYTHMFQGMCQDLCKYHAYLYLHIYTYTYVCAYVYMGWLHVVGSLKL